jgi:thymidylate synthase (FAD)
MKIRVQNPGVFLPDEYVAQIALMKCASRAQVSRARVVGYDDELDIANHYDVDNENYIVKNYEDAENTIHKLLSMKPFPHESVLEHGVFTVDFTMSRIASHQVVRHRHCGITQSSTRYVNLYKSDEVVFIKPPHADYSDIGVYDYVDEDYMDELPVWVSSAGYSYLGYKQMIDHGWKRESARYLLPQCLATSISITASLREWRHIIRLRTDSHASPEMQMMFNKVKDFMHAVSPVLVEDL